MITGKIPPSQSCTRLSAEIIDLLAAPPSIVPFEGRVQALALSEDLEKKILSLSNRLTSDTFRFQKATMLTTSDEKELATEVLRYRHLFTEGLLPSPRFRQAVLTVIQNIYLFKNRKIFFGTTTSSENERQAALLLFSSSPSPVSLPLAYAFQHLIIARVWNRIISHSTEEDCVEPHFSSLLTVVEKLNTLRNIYLLLTTKLVRKFAAQTNRFYKQSISYEDAVQIGTIGIARAAYRYHPSSGLRFSTFAAHWVHREIQKQALGGRLIRLSTNIIEGSAKAARNADSAAIRKFSDIIAAATSIDERFYEDNAPASRSEFAPRASSPVYAFESSQLRQILLETINRVLCKKTGDIIKRRFGLPPYMGDEQSILSISKVYNVTRSSIYQLEQGALRKLQSTLHGHLL